MTLAIVLSVMAGMAVGLRHRVLALIPIIIVAMAGAGVASAGQGPNAIVLAAIIGAATAQLGYLCGSVASILCRDASDPAVVQLSPSTGTYPLVSKQISARSS